MGQIVATVIGWITTTLAIVFALMLIRAAISTPVPG